MRNVLTKCRCILVCEIVKKHFTTTDNGQTDKVAWELIGLTWICTTFSTSVSSMANYLVCLTAAWQLKRGIVTQAEASLYITGHVILSSLSWLITQTDTDIAKRWKKWSRQTCVATAICLFCKKTQHPWLFFAPKKPCQSSPTSLCCLMLCVQMRPKAHSRRNERNCTDNTTKWKWKCSLYGEDETVNYRWILQRAFAYSSASGSHSVLLNPHHISKA